MEELSADEVRRLGGHLGRLVGNSLALWTRVVLRQWRRGLGLGEGMEVTFSENAKRPRQGLCSCPPALSCLLSSFSTPFAAFRVLGAEGQESTLRRLFFSSGCVSKKGYVYIELMCACTRTSLQRFKK